MSSTTVADMFLALARALPDKAAAISGHRELTYSDLVELSGRCANALAARGVRSGQRVGLALRDNADTLVAMLALWMIDAVPVPLDFRSRGEQRAAFVADFTLVHVVEDRSIGAAPYSSIVWDELAEFSTTLSSSVPERLGPPSAALISLTSGTTGDPLGIVFEHSELIARAQSFAADTPGYPRGGILVMAYPLAFSASRSHTFGMLATGGTVYFHPPTFGAGELIDRVNQLGAHLLFAVPATVSAMLKATEGIKAFAMPELSLLYCGASGMTPQDKVRAAKQLSPAFLHCFATSLAGTCSILTGEDLFNRSETDGRIIATVLCQAVDTSGRPVADGEVGELRVRSTSTVSNMVGGEREASDRIRNGWAYSGDLVRISADGFMTVVGRTSDMIVRSGTNVYPSEVEKALYRFPGVTEVAVVGLPDPEVGEAVVAFIVAENSVTTEDLVAHSRLSLSPDKRPRDFFIVGSLPRNASGKVLKRDLRNQALSGQPVKTTQD